MRLGRKTKRFLFVLGVCVLLFALVHTPPAKELARRIVSGTLASILDGEVSVGGLDYRLWRGEVELRNLSLAPAPTVLPLTFESSRVVARVSLGLQLSAELERAELALIDFFDTPSTDYTPLLPWIRSIQAKDGAIRFKDHDERGVLQEWISIDGVTIDVIDGLDEHRIGFHSREGHAFDESFGAIDADLYVTPMVRLRVASMSVMKDDSFARAEGELEFSNALTGAFDLNFAVDAALAHFIDEELDIRGIVTGSSRVRLQDGSPSLDAELSSEALEWQNVRAEDIEGEAGFTDGVLVVRRLEAQGFGGRARLGAEISFRDDARNRFDLVWNGIDPGEALALEARVSGEATLTLEDWNFDTASGQARVQLDPGFDIGGTLQASLESGVVALETRDATLPAFGASAAVEGTLTTTGDLDLDYAIELADFGTILADDAPMDTVGSISANGRVFGAITDPELTLALGSEDLQIEGDAYSLSAIAAGNARELALESATLLGERGVVTAHGTIPLVDSGSWGVEASLEGLAQGEVEIFGAASDPEWSARLRVAPEGFDISLLARKQGRQVFVEELTGTAISGVLDASGSYDLDTESIEGSMSLRDFRPSEVPVIAEYLDGLDAVLSMDASFAGPWRSPVGEAEIHVDALSLAGTALPSLTLSLAADEALVRARGVRGDGPEVLTGTLALTDDFPLHIDIPLGAVPLAELLHSIPIFLERQRGSWSMDGRASLDVPLSDLSRLEFQAQIVSLTGQFEDLVAKSSAFTVEGNLDHLRLGGYELRGEYNRLRVDGVVPLSAETEFDLEIDGNLRMDFLEILHPELDLEGEGRFELTVGGRRDDPRVEGDIRLENGEGRFGDITWSDLRFLARADENRLRELSVTANALDGRFSLGGDIPFLESSGAGQLQFTFEEVDLAPLVDPELTLIVSILGTVEVPTPGLDALLGSGRIERIAARSGGTAIDLTEPAPWQFENGALSVPRARFQGARSQIELSVPSLQLSDDLDFEASAAGTIDTAVVNALLAARGVSVGGLAGLELTASRKAGRLSLSGEGSLENGRFTSLDPGFVLSDVNASLSVQDSKLTIEELTARTGSGTLSGGGTVEMSDLARPVVDLRATADGVPLEVMDGLRAEVSGTVRLVSEEDDMRLTGNLGIDRGLLTREIDDDDASFSAQSVTFSDPTAPPGPFDQLALQVVIGTTRSVRVENSTAQLEAAGTVSFGGTLGSPELGGFVTLLPDGTFNVGRNRFQIVVGRVDLTGFPAVPPNVQLLAVTRVGSTVINADIEGDADDLRTRLTAPDDPDLTEGDLASLLVTGRTLENAGEGGQQIATTWMMSSMANLVHEGLGDLISFGPPAGAGPLILAEEADPTARLSLGFPVTERTSITYSIALDNSERRMWILDYRVARNFWIRAIQENSNDYSFGISQRFSLDFRGSTRTARATRDQYVSGVTFVGATQQLADRVRIQFGDRYDYWKARDEAAKMEEQLVKDGYKSAVVEVETTVDESDARDDVTLQFIVVPGKPTEFAWRGDDPGGKLKSLAEDRWEGRIPEDFLLTDLARLAETRLRADRYYLAEVSASIEEEEEKRAVVFDVQQGLRGKEVQLSFHGNEVLSDRELSEALPRTDSPEFFLLLARTAELERGVRLRYAADGYLNAATGAPAVHFDPDAGTFFVEIPIEEGRQTTVAVIEFQGQLSLDTEKLLSEFGVVPGTPVDFPEIRRGQTRLRTLYRNEGFPDVRVRAALERSVNGLNISIAVEEGLRARVGEVIIVGNSRTRPSVIRNELTFRADDPVRLIDFQETQKRLYDLGIFRSADVRPDPSQQGLEVQNILIQVVERADLDVNYGLRYNAINSELSATLESEPRSSGLEVTARANLVNQIGRGTNLGLSIFFASNFQLYRGTFRIPTFFKRRIITEFIAETERHQERYGVSDFQTRGSGITFQQTKKLTDDRYEKFALQWNFRFGTFTGRRFSDGGDVRSIDTNRPRAGISLIEDRRDSFANPTRGRFWNVTFQLVPEIWGSDVGYIRLYGQLFYYYPLTRSIVWASGVRLGIAKGTKELLLMEDRFLAGGANSVRGFKQNALGPSVIIQDTQERLYVGGQGVTVLNQELRFPIYKALHGGAYVDAGNVFATASQMRLSDLRVSAGAGLRFVLPFGAIRFDWAEVLNPQPMDETIRWHFSFGYAF